MAEVVIGVENSQNSDLIGKMVPSKIGRDKNRLYAIMGHLSDDYAILNNGSTKVVQMPKKKNLKHINVLEGVNDEVKASIISKDRNTDLKIKRSLKLKGTVKEG